MTTIIIAGGGLAGCVSAIGLTKLGYDVTIITRPRPFGAYEGFSQRSYQALEGLGCHHALKAIGPHCWRYASWGGETRQANAEYLTYRPDFDAALIQDAIDHGVHIIEGSVLGPLVSSPQGVTVTYKTPQGRQTLQGTMGIEARGRFAPMGEDYTHGPTSYALLQPLLGEVIPPRTSLESVEQGWIWQASLHDGRRYIQVTTTAQQAQELRHFDDLKAFVLSQTHQAWSLEHAQPCAPLIIRDSRTSLIDTPVKETIYYVGDAASMVDPLSGNGTFQALSQATILPYVIHTTLIHPSDAPMAHTFYQNRVHDIFDRYSRLGQAFYQQESYKNPFWHERQSWPTSTPSVKPHIAQGAVVLAPFIVAQEVYKTPHNPLGVWMIENHSIIPMARKLLAYPEEQWEHIILSCCDDTWNDHEKHLISHWFLTHGRS